MIICAIITRTDKSRKRIKRIVQKRTAKIKATRPIDELHASDLNTAEKQDILNKLTAQNDYEVAYLVADKNHLIPELKNRPNLCFNYLFNILFKSLIIDYSAEDIRIIADNRTVSAGSKNSLPEYIMTEAYAEWGYQKNLVIEFIDSREVKGLQAVDLIANSIYAKYNLNKEHLYQMHGAHYITRIKFPQRKFGVDQ